MGERSKDWCKSTDASIADSWGGGGGGVFRAVRYRTHLNHGLLKSAEDAAASPDASSFAEQVIDPQPSPAVAVAALRGFCVLGFPSWLPSPLF